MGEGSFLLGRSSGLCPSAQVCCELKVTGRTVLRVNPQVTGHGWREANGIKSSLDDNNVISCF